MDFMLPVVGGLALFLYGMNIMGSGLEKTAGNRLSRLIEVLTSNKLMAVIVGAVVTVAVQSSSATTVMVIGFVNAGLMNLSQAVGVIMGANVGTTITAQIIALDLTAYVPVALILGVIMMFFSKKKKVRSLGEVFVGFGLLFLGMDMMGNGLAPLSELEAFKTLIVRLENPILGALTGVMLTTVLQSSSAAIGLLQALASQGLIGINIAFPILFGENIGTTTTALLSSIGAGVSAKRAAVIHFLFNLTGTVLFMTVLRKPVEMAVLYVSPDNVQLQIANAHTLFNIINVIIQFPFMNYLVKAAEKLVPDSDAAELQVSLYLDNRILKTPSIALGQVNKEVIRMGDLVGENLNLARRVLVDEEYDSLDEGLEREDLINKIEREITEYLVHLSHGAISQKQHEEVNTLLYTINDIERIGDHVENMLELGQSKVDVNAKFSDLAKEHLDTMFRKSELVFGNAMKSFETDDEDLAREVEVLEDEIDDLEEYYREDHITRLNQRTCSTRSGLIFLDTLSNLERVSDHSYNISKYVYGDFNKVNQAMD